MVLGGVTVVEDCCTLENGQAQGLWYISLGT